MDNLQQKTLGNTRYTIIGHGALGDFNSCETRKNKRIRVDLCRLPFSKLFNKFASLMSMPHHAPSFHDDPHALFNEYDKS